MKQTYTNKEFERLVESTVNTVLKEIYDKSSETHFAVNKKTNLIVNGWDYSDYDPDELRQFKNDYFSVDLRDNNFDPKEYKILTRKTLVRMGIDPSDNSNWSNDGITRLGK